MRERPDERRGESQSVVGQGGELREGKSAPRGRGGVGWGGRGGPPAPLAPATCACAGVTVTQMMIDSHQDSRIREVSAKFSVGGGLVASWQETPCLVP